MDSRNSSSTKDDYTLAMMLNASPAWWGYAGFRDWERLERMINKLRIGISSPRCTIILDFSCCGGQTLLLITTKSRPDHVLRHLRLPRKQTQLLCKDARNPIPRHLYDQIILLTLSFSMMLYRSCSVCPQPVSNLETILILFLHPSRPLLWLCQFSGRICIT